jgi:ABC-type oligopeptide transport system substrate-binding subunit
VSISNVSHNVQVADQDTGAYQAILSQFGSYQNPFLTVQPFVATGTTNNGYGYQSSKIDSYLTKIEETPLTNTAAITNYWEEIATLENTAGANVPLFAGRANEVVNKNLHGVDFEGEQIYYETAWWS